ncbi:hypothetical protein TRFO_28271 [Tritrichomonas foetus]|uniref:Protein kinase domain-containing protein n=1 Tax=Tritrichomonas foetus TaxID=1144522 RepID=A0A1J4K0J8_9EUKA|nr:hypothetical protein TRFO_28271 [Tritrichomonas foetus]|eukprot:OHT04280.1 hypothetical protein TRFO_28271 [Tritrichomonas foetus]
MAEEFRVSPEFQCFAMSMKDFKLGKRIGAGGNGEVRLATHIATKKVCVLKKQAITETDLEKLLQFKREVELLATFKHPAIVPFIGFCSASAPNYFIYLKMMEKGNVTSAAQLIAKKPDPKWHKGKELIIAYGIASAMEFLHRNNVVHRDLKGENILLDENYYPFVTDFGSAKCLDSLKNAGNPKVTCRLLTPYISAPELLKNVDEIGAAMQTKEIDIFAYSMILYIILMKSIPFGVKATVFMIQMKILEGNYPEIAEFVPQHWRELIEECRDMVPSKRPQFSSIVKRLKSEAFTSELTPEQLTEFQEYVALIDSEMGYAAPEPAASEPAESIATPNVTPAADKGEKIVEYVTSKVSTSPSASPTKSLTSTLHPDAMTMPKPSTAAAAAAASAEVGVPLIEKLKIEADKGKLAAILQYAEALFTGSCCEVDLLTARTYYNKIAILNANSGVSLAEIAESEFKIGECFRLSGEFQSASNFYKRSTQHGNAEAAFELAELLFEGKIPCRSGIERNTYYKRAADFGLEKAINKYAQIMYWYGDDGQPNKRIAIEYFKKGSDLGDPEMMYLWSCRCEYGRDVPQNIPEAMKLLQNSAELNYAPAQYNLAIHLYNGIHMKKDVDLSIEYFRRAATQDHPKALLFYSILTRESDPEQSNEFFEKSRNLNDFDAWALNGDFCLSNGDPNTAIESYFYALTNDPYMQNPRSMYAMTRLGNYFESTSNETVAQEFYELGAHNCHALDEQGFLTPLEFTFYHCSTCGEDVCESCSKVCHSGHNLKALGILRGHSCSCGRKGLQGHCSSEYLGTSCCQQHLYQCNTCCFNDSEKYICSTCKNTCHSGHEVVDCGLVKGFCSCGVKNLPHNFKCKVLDYNHNSQPHQCSCLTYGSDQQRQRWFKCATCSLYGCTSSGVCESCVNHCHSQGHIVYDVGVQSGVCGCINNGTCILTQ